MLYLFFLLLTFPTIILTQKNEECKCVRYYLCDPKTGKIIEDGVGLFNPRLGGECSCSCKADEVCCQLNTNTTHVPIKKTKTNCGISNPDGVGFKSSQSPDYLNFGEFPWNIDILDESGAYRCEGSLIHPSVVLTAAHCVTKKKNYVVRAGDWDSSTTSEILKHQDLIASSVKIHQSYYPPLQHNDLALIFLNGSFVLGDHIRTICLPSNDDEINENCMVSGRGKDANGNYGDLPKKIEVPLVDQMTCQNNLRNTKLGENFHLHKSSLCAGGEAGKDACVGDGGGALICSKDGDEKYKQIGIVSWGIGCGRDKMPGVYTNVKVLRSWIDNKLKENNIILSL